MTGVQVLDERGLPNSASLKRIDKDGRHYSILVPPDRDLKLAVSGREVDLSDEKGKTLGKSDPPSALRVTKQEKVKVVKFRVGE